MTQPPLTPTSGFPAAQEALLATLARRVDELTAENTAFRVEITTLRVEIATLQAENTTLQAENTGLRVENAALREKLSQPPKTPENSSTPPSRGQKPNAAPGTRSAPKSKVHPGVHRPLHPKPDHHREVYVDQCPHCQAAVAHDGQKPRHDYDRIEIPVIKPDVTRVTLFGGTCTCCHKRFTAVAPPGLEPGSPFGPNLRSLVLYLHYSQAIPFERLAKMLSVVLGLEISEGAITNILEASRLAFETQVAGLRARLLSGTVLESDEISSRVGKRTWWTWVFHHGDTACFVVEPSRAKTVVEGFLGDIRPPPGFPTDTAAKPAGRLRSTNSALPIFCARSSTKSRPAAPKSRLSSRACSNVRSGSAAGGPRETIPCLSGLSNAFWNVWTPS